MTPVRTEPVTIREVPDDGWLVYWGAGEPQHFDVAVRAMDAVKARDAKLAEAGISCVTVVTWDAVTNVGAAIARSFGGSK